MVYLLIAPIILVVVVVFGLAVLSGAIAVITAAAGSGARAIAQCRRLARPRGRPRTERGAGD